MGKPIFVYLVGTARRVWRWSPERNIVKREAVCCAKCGTKFSTKNKPEIDHIEGVGVAPKGLVGWDAYYQRLFCDRTKLQALCKKCHKEKTKREAAERKRQREKEKLNGDGLLPKPPVA